MLNINYTRKYAHLYYKQLSLTINHYKNNTKTTMEPEKPVLPKQ